MTEPHLHCGECRRVIETTCLNAAGETIDVPVAGGTQFAVRPGPSGLELLQVQVPLCPECFDRVNAATAQSKLVVPQNIAKGLRRPS